MIDVMQIRLPMELPSHLGDGVHRLRLSGRPAVVKIGRRKPTGFFFAEARGLAALRAVGAMRVPEVYAVQADGIVLEDLGSGRADTARWAQAGCELARLHRCRGPRFGFEANGWCGDSPQDNGWDADGFRFFAERRLLPQGRAAFDRGLLDHADLARLEALCSRLPERLPGGPPVLVHGDLWLGNLHVCADGALALLDGGAVHYGWAQGDLAMLTLFGAPDAELFAAYEAEAGIDRGWRQHAPLLNLYHLLNHLNLFGGEYLGRTRAVLAHYA
jgi:fructosamine-3-kinase